MLKLMLLERPTIPRRVSPLPLLRRGTRRSLPQTSTVTASPMLPSLDQHQEDRFFQSFWADQTDLSLRESILQFRQVGSRWAISTETASSTSSLSPTFIYLLRAFFWETGMAPSDLRSH